MQARRRASLPRGSPLASGQRPPLAAASPGCPGLAGRGAPLCSHSQHQLPNFRLRQVGRFQHPHGVQMPTGRPHARRGWPPHCGREPPQTWPRQAGRCLVPVRPGACPHAPGYAERDALLHPYVVRMQADRAPAPTLSATPSKKLSCIPMWCGCRHADGRSLRGSPSRSPRAAAHCGCCPPLTWHCLAGRSHVPVRPGAGSALSATPGGTPPSSLRDAVADAQTGAPPQGQPSHPPKAAVPASGPARQGAAVGTRPAMPGGALPSASTRRGCP
jgi:hypothetical protein